MRVGIIIPFMNWSWTDAAVLAIVLAFVCFQMWLRAAYRKKVSIASESTEVEAENAEEVRQLLTTYRLERVVKS